ncbi:uncharacterized [Tachysurus ichikawai]
MSRVEATQTNCSAFYYISAAEAQETGDGASGAPAHCRVLFVLSGDRSRPSHFCSSLINIEIQNCDPDPRSRTKSLSRDADPDS